MEVGRATHVTCTVSLLGLLVVISAVLQLQDGGGALAVVLQLSGGLCQSAVSFLLPALLALRLLDADPGPWQWGRQVRAWLLLAVGLTLPLAVGLQILIAVYNA